ncbi:hypothetical protein KC19_7G093600 [Ceratodon purpureus]|uniref:DNA-directed RNA polymerase subunit beta n=1 Tax=Ceratodon purpureus TaxID=3225 RepID=A0A8T0H947_CERPU|nr:hypothetical protein KC19_7G093600 [Ceratodon purpureus]
MFSYNPGDKTNVAIAMKNSKCIPAIVPAQAYATPFYPENFNNPLEVVREKSKQPSHRVVLGHNLKSPQKTHRPCPPQRGPQNLEARLSRAEEEVVRNAVAKIFFKGRSLVEHHLRSFNEFLEYGLPAMFDEAFGIECLPDRGPLPGRIGGALKKARILYGEVSVGKPYTTIVREGNKEVVDLLPNEARLRNMSYSAHLYVNMTLEVYENRGNEKAFNSEDVIDTKTDTICIGKIPVMVNSSFCHLHGLTEKEAVAKGHCAFDSGGYFIIKGSEKVLIAQEEKAHQGIYVNYLKRTDTWIATYSPTWRGFTSNQAQRGKTFVKLVKRKRAEFSVGIPGLTEPVPLVILYRALGTSSDKDLLESICYDSTDSQLHDLLLPSIGAADLILGEFLEKVSGPGSTATPRSVRDQVLAVRFLGTKLRYSRYAPSVEAGKTVIGQLFAHIEGGYTRKAFLLGYMVNQLCSTFLGRRPEEDKDNFKNKRVDLAGQLMSHQFRKAMAHLERDIKKRIQPHLEKDMELAPLKAYVTEDIVTKQMQTAFTLGNWNTNEGLKSSGVVGVLKRMNPMATLSHLRQVRLNLPPPTKPTDAARHPNYSYWGRICPMQYSDGADCGLLKNLALTCIVSSDSPEEPVLHVLGDCGMKSLEEINPCTISMAEKIFVNGRWVGIFYDHNEAVAIVNTLKNLRRGQFIHGEIEVARDTKAKAVHIHTDAGRLLRPLLIVKDQKLAMSKHHLKTLRIMSKKESAETCWNYLLEQEVVEILGTEEEQGALIALNRDDLERAQKDPDFPLYTHSEIDVAYILGLGASVIPFLEHNQASRVLYQAEKHCKQAMGFYTSNISGRTDCSGHQLFYPQKPLVTTRAWDYLQKPELTNGQVAIVSIQCYGYNQEESIIMNRASIDRGLFRSLHFRNYRGEERYNVIEYFAKPSTNSETSKSKVRASLRKLDDDGFPHIGEFLQKGDIIIGKLTAEVGTSTLADSSQHLKAHENGRVDQVLLSSEDDGHRIAKVRLRYSRRPQNGDKFTSMHGQKGVIGAVFNQEDLPFTQQGIVPDIIINPHALPNRQTVGQLLEGLFGKVVAAGAVRQCVTPFQRKSATQKFMDQLHQCGYQRGGSESMCNGTTGKRLKALISIGATFYQKLDHMVEDKIKYRGSGGPVDVLTRQPVKNRKSMGGVKFGEMERDCMMGHGAAVALRERYFLLSDPYRMYVCSACRRPSCRKEKIRRHFCTFCETGKHVVQIEIPYACKLLWQELLSMGITMLLDTKLTW